MKKFAPLFVLLIAALALVACGSSDDSTTGAEETTPPAKEGGNGGEKEAEGGSAGSAAAFDVEADPSGGLEFTTDEATAKAGEVVVNFTNSSPVPHDVRIEDSGGKDIGGTEVFAEGNESAKVDLKPGEYTFYCSVPGHRQAGMEGTLEVE